MLIVFRQTKETNLTPLNCKFDKYGGIVAGDTEEGGRSWYKDLPESVVTDELIVVNTCRITCVSYVSPLRTKISEKGRESVYEFILPMSFGKTIDLLNGVVPGEKEKPKGNWQDQNRTVVEVERVYETRWDCCIVPDGVRHAA
jgi:hypothetical protein